MNEKIRASFWVAEEKRGGFYVQQTQGEKNRERPSGRRAAGTSCVSGGISVNLSRGMNLSRNLRKKKKEKTGPLNKSELRGKGDQRKIRTRGLFLQEVYPLWLLGRGVLGGACGSLTPLASVGSDLQILSVSVA